MEIWNLVFIQDQVDHKLRIVGSLPAKNVDTGSSLERVAMVLQGVENVFETDLLRPMLEVGESLSGKEHGPRSDGRRLAEDHRRARPRDDVPDRGRRAAFERGPRVHPAADAPAERLPRAPPGSRRRCSTRRSPRSSRRSATRIRAPRERGVRPSGRAVGGGAVLGDPPSGDDAVRGGEGAGERRIASGTPSSSPTRSFPCSSPRSSRPRRAHGGHRSVRGAARGTAAPRPRRREEGCRSASTRARPRRPSSWDTRPWSPTAYRVDPRRGVPRAPRRGGRPGGPALPRPHAVLRGGRRAGGRPRVDPHAVRSDPRRRTPCRRATFDPA